MDFENKAPKWDATGAEPSADLQNNGFQAGYKPPASYFNYLFNRISAAINELHAKLSKVDNTADSEKPVSTAQATAIADAKAAGTKAQTDITNHTKNNSNPHNVTKEQVGLGNVPNVSTNDQTPTYSDTSTLATLASGEKLNVAFQKIKLAITTLINHVANKSNPHEVTKEQVGLGNVPNVATNDQTPTYSDTSTLATLSSGEKLNVAMQKIKLAITTLINHVGNKSNPHGVTAAQAGALPIGGGELTGGLTVMDNFNVNKTFNDVEYKTYARPINYSIGNNGDYSTGLIHYKENVNQAQLMFNKDGVMLRDNVNAKAYKLFGQHNAADMPFLPLTGGTLSGTLSFVGGDKNAAIFLQSDGNFTFRDNINNKILCFKGDESLASLLFLFDGANSFSYPIYGRHNKPSGTYSGNGNTTNRTINTGGIGNVLFIWIEGAFAMVTPIGAAIFKDGTSSVTFLAGDRVNFQNGILALRTNNESLNKSGATYMYQVL